LGHAPIDELEGFGELRLELGAGRATVRALPRAQIRFVAGDVGLRHAHERRTA
jgi:hypothetical protein